jgi:hypothetical protein
VGKGGNLIPGRLASQSVALIVKAYAARPRLDPDVFSEHSLRSGFLTSAAARGASLFKMMDVSRHKSVDTLRRYVRDADLFRDHAGGRTPVVADVTRGYLTSQGVPAPRHRP